MCHWNSPVSASLTAVNLPEEKIQELQAHHDVEGIYEDAVAYAATIQLLFYHAHCYLLGDKDGDQGQCSVGTCMLAVTGQTY